MIESKELRVDNLVYYGKSIRAITAIHSNPSRSVVGVDNILTSFDVINPMPLTPEILEKCGFEKEEVTADCGAIWRNNGFHIASHHSYEGFRLLGFHNKSVPIQHLHQLQNLYYALTQTELEVKL